MRSGTLDDPYLAWLYSQVGNVKTRKGPRTFWGLFGQLYDIEFAWFIPNDDNRATDGRELRLEWVGGSAEDFDQPEWLETGCSFLEMLIGLSRRLAFEAGGDVPSWFWHLMDNLNLRAYNDQNYDEFRAGIVEEIVNKVIWRTYDENGNGGLFPLRCTSNDQRQVEIWYQLSEYLQQGS